MNFNGGRIYIISLIFITRNFRALAATAVNSSEFGKCDYYQELGPTSRFSIASPGWPRKYSSAVKCRWAAEAPVGYRLSLECSRVEMPALCRDGQISVSTTGRADLSDARRFCGRAPIRVESLKRRLTVSLKAMPVSGVGRFYCSVRTIKNKCTCGSRNRGKIAGGSATVPNEYPSMAGLVDFLERRIFCGATIISSTHALSAAHCKSRRVVSNLGIIVGEHDTKLGSDSAYTRLVRISQFIAHERFDARTNEHDIALVKTAETLTFNRGVQAACLPFRFTSTPIVSRNVQAAGWGSTEFAGPQSSILQHVTLRVVDYGNCTMNQICSHALNKDTCQSDSGGPLYLTEKNLLYVVGIVSYGFECATQEPAVNTRVTSYLNWILENTPGIDYCVP